MPERNDHFDLPADSRETPYYHPNERVDIVRHARDAGRDNLPLSAATTPNDVEAAIIHHHGNSHRAAVESARAELRSLTEQFTAIHDELQTPRDLHRIPSNALAAAEQELASDQVVEQARRELGQHQRDERRFQREHMLSREAQYPASRWLHLGWLGVVVVLESALNAGFFAAASALGPLGGFLIAVGLSLVNVTSGVVAGFFPLRYLNSRGRVTRLLAITGMAAYVVLAVTLNLAVAHVRDLAATTQGVSAAEIGVLLEHPFRLSLTSLALLMVGLIASALAVWEGLTLDDRVPGYGEIARRRAAASARYLGASESLRARVLAHTEAVPRLCAEQVDQSRGRLNDLGELVTQAGKRHERYDTERTHAERWMHVHLKRYRHENAAVRTTPPPAYFDDYPLLPPEVDDTVVRDLTTRLLAAREQHEALAAEGHEITLAQPVRMAGARRQVEQFLTQAVNHADDSRGEVVSRIRLLEPSTREASR